MGILPCRSGSHCGHIPLFISRAQEEWNVICVTLFLQKRMQTSCFYRIYITYTITIYLWYIWVYIYPYICTVSMTAVFYSFCWNTCIAHKSLPPPSYPQNLWLRLFVFISPNCRGHVLPYPIVVILLVDGRVYVPCPNNRGGKKNPSRPSPVTSQSCVLFSAIISLCLSFCLWTHLGLCVMLT